MSCRAQAVNALIDLVKLPGDVKRASGLEYTPSEIAQQPTAWAETFLRFQKSCAQISNFLVSAGLNDRVGHRPTVFLVGAGSSDYIGKSLMHLLRRQWQCDVVAVPNTDLLTEDHHYLLPNRRYLWISFSRSGDTPEAVAVLEKALRDYPEVKHLVVSCNANGRLLQLQASTTQIFKIVLDDSVNDRGLAMTSSFSNMLICGQCIAHAFHLSSYAPILQELISRGSALLTVVPDLAAKLASKAFRKVCFIGTGPLEGIARECSLKVLELTGGKTHGMWESPLALRHGPMSALDQDTLLISFVSSDERRRNYEIDLLTEIANKKLVNTRVAVSCEGKPLPAELAEYSVPLGSVSFLPDCYRGPSDVIVGQLLGLFLSLHWSITPDSPSSNNVINRVVQNVRIHD